MHRMCKVLHICVQALIWFAAGWALGTPLKAVPQQNKSTNIQNGVKKSRVFLERFRYSCFMWAWLALMDPSATVAMPCHQAAAGSWNSRWPTAAADSASPVWSTHRRLSQLLHGLSEPGKGTPITPQWVSIVLERCSCYYPFCSDADLYAPSTNQKTSNGILWETRGYQYASPGKTLKSKNNHSNSVEATLATRWAQSSLRWCPAAKVMFRCRSWQVWARLLKPLMRSTSWCASCGDRRYFPKIKKHEEIWRGSWVDWQICKKKQVNHGHFL